MIENKLHNSTPYTNVNSKARLEVLCFDKNEFMKDNFSIDEFLHKNRNVPSLEQLRDNLGIYLKGLRASMIDLINEDYADFVSLSANLVGLDQSIDSIQRPLEQFRLEILSINNLIDENEKQMRNYLEEKCYLRELKRNLQSLQNVHEILINFDDVLALKLNGDKIRAMDLERASLQIIQLKVHQKFCNEYLNQEQKDKIDAINVEILEKLRTFFNESLHMATSTTSENLERCLRMYVTLDAPHIAEMVFREDVVAPNMSKIISEYELQNSQQGLAGIYSKILDFISLHMTDLLRLTHYTEKIKGLNFLVNSFWVDVEMRLETHLSSIFAPGNSEIFYSKYKCTKNFMSRIEELLAYEEAIQLFRKHKQTKSFTARWNLPVYFQICFQEIAGKFENTLEPLCYDDILNTVDSSNQFHLKPFNSACKSINRCWEEGIFLFEIFPKFYKLTLQIILRLSRWITDVLNALTTNQSIVIEVPAKMDKTDFIVTLFIDISEFKKSLLKIENKIHDIISNTTPQHSILNGTLKKSFLELLSVYDAHLATIKTALVNILITEIGLDNIRQVNDLPRLYRKTNRDIPRRASVYIEQMLSPLNAFRNKELSRLSAEVVHNILKQVICKITVEYFSAVSDVLNSVQKTEESLRRLKLIKSAGGTTSPATSVSTRTMSDDDKIRLQLRVDVNAWSKELATLNFMPTEIEKLIELNNIVDESIKTRDIQI